MRSSYPTVENTVFFHEEDIVKAYNLYINFTEKEIAEIYKDSQDDLAFLLLVYGSNKVVDGFISLSQKESAILTLLNKYDIINYNHSFSNKTELSSIIIDSNMIYLEMQYFV